MKKTYSFVIFCIFFISAALALDIPKVPKSYVLDKAEIISATIEKQIENLLHQFELETSNQVLVATFKSLDGESLEDFSIRLAEAWKPGQKNKDNGVILLIFHNDRKIRIEVGYGLEGALPDITAGEIIRNEIAPSFKKGAFDEGIQKGLLAIIQATKGEYKGKSKFSHARRSRQNQSVIFLLALKMTFFLCIVLFFIDLVRFGGYLSGHKTYSKRYSFLEWLLRFGFLLIVMNILLKVIFYAMIFGRGGGYYGSRSGFSGGGFSSGGGSFGGGGASGGW